VSVFKAFILKKITHTYQIEAQFIQSMSVSFNCIITMLNAFSFHCFSLNICKILKHVSKQNHILKWPKGFRNYFYITIYINRTNI